MGNAYAIKIKKVGSTNLLRDIVFANNLKIVEFLYYITKINKYHVENFIKGSLVKEFTLLNILNRKEYNVVIERVESGFFFEDLEYSFEVLPSLEKVLFVSNIVENSKAYEKGIRADTMILLGTQEKYFSSFENVEEEIMNKNAKFVFYDFCEDMNVYVNFEEFRDEEQGLKMGFECEEFGVNEIYEKIRNNVKRHFDARTVKQITYQNSHSDVTTFDEFSNIVNDASNNITDEKQKENLINNKENFDIIEKIETAEIMGRVINTDNITNNEDLIHDTIKSLDANIFNDKQEDESTNSDKIKNNNTKDIFTEEVITVTTNNLNSESKINIDNLNSSSNNRDKFPTTLTTNNSKGTSSSSSSSSSTGAKDPDANIKEHSKIPLTKNKNFKYNFSKCKEKYNKYLSIYEKIDSNFNFMNISKKVNQGDEVNTNSSANFANSTNSNNFVLKEENLLNATTNDVLCHQGNSSSLLEKNKRIFLIKGFFLSSSATPECSSLKVKDLEENTINVE